MNRFTFRWMAFAAFLLAPDLSYSQVSCTREGLQAAAELYIAAQTKGDIEGLPLAKGLGYVENFKTMDINDGLIKKAMKIDHHRSLVDTSTCQTFTEVIVTNKVKPLCARHAAARESCADRRNRDTVDYDWLLAV